MAPSRCISTKIIFASVAPSDRSPRSASSLITGGLPERSGSARSLDRGPNTRCLDYIAEIPYSPSPALVPVFWEMNHWASSPAQTSLPWKCGARKTKRISMHLCPMISGKLLSMIHTLMTVRWMLPKLVFNECSMREVHTHRAHGKKNAFVRTMANLHFINCRCSPERIRLGQWNKLANISLSIRKGHVY